MELNNQTQKAGDNATQVQAGVVNYYTNIAGIDEKRAREICKEEYALVAQNWSQEALKIANERVQSLEDKVLPKFLEIDSTLHFFADPTFQMTLRKAQMTAASAERDSDFDLLSDLLVHSIEQKGDKKRELGIARAIEVVNQVDYQALVGLSMMYAISNYVPKADTFAVGLKILDSLYGKLMDNQELPQGNDWLEHLDLLTAIRLHQGGLTHFKKIEEYIPLIMPRFFTIGLKQDSAELAHIRNEFDRVHLPQTFLIIHPYKTDYIQLNVDLDIEKITLKINISEGTIVEIRFNAEQKSVLRNAMELMHKADNIKDKDLQEYFCHHWDSYPNLKKVREWWNNLSSHFSVTPLGVALANAYNKTKYSGVPCLY